MRDAKTEERKSQRLPLVFFPDAKLYEVSVPVRAVDQGIRDLAADMIETMNQAGGVGLSAIQVGKPVRLFVMKSGEENLVLINPIWFNSSGSAKEFLQEGCLSFPSVFEEIERYTEIEVEFFSINGEYCHRIFEGVDAHVVQHEVEHLDGKLFVQHLPIHRRDSIRTKMKKRERTTARFDRIMSQNDRSIQSLVKAGFIKLPVRPGFRSGK